MRQQHCPCQQCSSKPKAEEKDPLLSFVPPPPFLQLISYVVTGSRDGPDLTTKGTYFTIQLYEPAIRVRIIYLIPCRDSSYMAIAAYFFSCSSLRRLRESLQTFEEKLCIATNPVRYLWCLDSNIT